jgi:rhodanese-related sulfurtransferase
MIPVIEKISFNRPEEVSRMVYDREPIAIIDVRPGIDYDMGHIQGAISLPPEAWEHCEFLKKDELNVVYGSYHARDTQEAVELLSQKGFRVSIMEGGFDAWLASGLPLSAR